MSKFKVGDTVKVLSHKNKEMIGKVSTITEVLKDSNGIYLYKVKGIKNYATEKDIEKVYVWKRI
jgi:ribosomal protein L24